MHCDHELHLFQSQGTRWAGPLLWGVTLPRREYHVAEKVFLAPSREKPSGLGRMLAVEDEAASFKRWGL